MRIDKYLKASRIIKRRTVSKELAENGRIEINDKIVKPSHEVNVGDIIKIRFGNRQLEIKVLSITESKHKQDALDMYEVVLETRGENLESSINE